MIMYVLLYYPVSFHMWQLLLTGRPISSVGMTLSLVEECLIAVIFQCGQI